MTFLFLKQLETVVREFEWLNSDLSTTGQSWWELYSLNCISGKLTCLWGNWADVAKEEIKVQWRQSLYAYQNVDNTLSVGLSIPSISSLVSSEKRELKSFCTSSLHCCSQNWDLPSITHPAALPGKALQLLPTGSSAEQSLQTLVRLLVRTLAYSCS